MSKGLVSGYNDGTFKPDNPITRAEFVAFINRAFNLTQTANITFKDVKSTDWFYKDIQKAKAAGIVSGYDDNTFRPNATITREEAISIVVKLKKLTTVSSDYLSNFNDINNISEWAKDAVNTAVAYGLIKGDSANTINPKGFITRAETIVILNRSLGDLQLKPVPTLNNNSSSSSANSNNSGSTSSNIVAAVFEHTAALKKDGRSGLGEIIFTVN